MSVHERFNFPTGLSVIPSSSPNPLTLFPHDQQLEASIIADKSRSHVHSSPSNDIDGTDEDPPAVDSIVQDIPGYGIAGRIWEAAYDLLTYFAPPSWLSFDPPCSLISRPPSSSPPDTSDHDNRTKLTKVVVELGSGTGIAGLSAAASMMIPKSSDGRIGNNVISSLTPIPIPIVVLTDLGEVVPLLEANVTRWQEGIVHGRRGKMAEGEFGVNILVRALPWGDHLAADGLIAEIKETLSSGIAEVGITHVICSDLVYFPSLLAPLLRTLLHLTGGDSDAARSAFGQNHDENRVQVIISCRIRDLEKEWPFWAAFGGWFDFKPVLQRDTRCKHPNWERYGVPGETWIFIARRRKESLGRDVDAMSDVELMGVQSDRFELLLQLSLRSGESDSDGD